MNSFWKKQRKDLDNRAAHGKIIKDEWNSGCGRPKLWQAYGKLVGSELNELNAAEVLGQGHRSEIMGYKLSKVDAARLNRWTNVCYAK